MVNDPVSVTPATPQFPIHELNLDETQPTTPAQPQATSDSSPTNPMTSKTSFFRKHRKALGITTAVILIVFGLFGGIGLYTAAIAQSLKSQGTEAAGITRATMDQFKAQNLPAAEQQLRLLQQKVNDIKSTYDKLAFYQYIPVARSYYLDGRHGLLAAQEGTEAGLKAIAAVTPYADVLGFSGQGTFEGGAAENRIKLILQTLEKVIPVMDEIVGHLDKAKSELDQVNEKRYPENIGGLAIRSKIVEGKQTLDNTSMLLKDYRPIITQLPSIAGADGQRKKYLVLFQNDNELRPTGGFLTAYSVIFMENGVITPEKSDDIYELDKKFTKKIPIPEVLGRYLTTEKIFHLRDMNTSPDFKVSMQQFFDNYKNLKGEPNDINGIIAVDTQVLNDLVKIVGPIEVPGYGTFSAENDKRCDCPQIIYALSEIITRPTPYLRQDRKGILAPLMQSILKRIYQSPRVFMGQLFQVGLDGVNGRHLQTYFFDEKYQQAAEAINAAGRMIPPGADSDFFAMIDANLGGAKSNLFTNYEMKQTVTPPENGRLTKTVEITYKNSRRGDNCNLEAGLLCLNATLRDWARIYVPAGSQLIEVQGFTTEPKEYEDLGFHVFDGYFLLEPMSQAKIKITYSVPYTDDNKYNLKIWKQGGLGTIPTLIDVNGNQHELTVNSDTTFSGDF